MLIVTSYKAPAKIDFEKLYGVDEIVSGKVERIVRENEDLTVKNDLMYAVVLILIGVTVTIGALITFKCLT